ncbi:hypothetical protein DCAR_0935799 [Daucus carota subsp. sativus]|uniref:Uncharacterized protein n=1 Tax=Daucus carota subsp. sativus TaxID=79200 RepID=A0AAF1BDZ5_DAUCS|nr:PREDICTED: transcription termination factor MTERF5, chloroplastic [Daucus carota subsp. sativus]WOH16249.1 hypothetical protein DCAR_0935799 [Daucus carota subsp. sativus]
MHTITTPTSSNLLPYSSTSLQKPLVKKPNNLFISTLTTNKTITKFLANPSYRNRNRNQTVLASASGPPEAEPEQEEGALGSAIEAVSEIMRECSGGSLSGEECYRMAENSPNYVKMLVGSVCELGFDQNSGDFKERVFEMGVEKGDKGIVPFLESSFELSLPAAMHISRLCLSSNQSLPNLVVKVNYLKEMLFSDDGDEGSGDIGKDARKMMMRLSISVDDDGLQQTLAFFEKTQARRGGLNMLGDRDASFQRLIHSFPRILLLSLETRLKPIVEFLKDVGVPKRKLRNVVLLYPPIMFQDVEKDIKSSFFKVNAGNKVLGRLLLKYPWVLSSSIQRNYTEIHSFFDTKMVPKSSVDLAIKSWPHLLGCSVDKLKLMVKQFAELGISDKKLGQVIAKSPQLLLQKPQEFQQVVNYLKESGLDEETVGRVLGRCPEIFATDVDRVLRKKIEFLNSIGVSGVCLPYVIKKYPELYVCDIGKALHPRVMYLMEIGLSRKDVASMVSRFSPLLGYSIKEVLKPKSEFLLNTMRKPLSEVVNYPRYFSYSMEKKIEPRYWELRSRNVECSLKDMLSKNDEEFAAEFLSIEKNPDHVR